MELTSDGYDLCDQGALFAVVLIPGMRIIDRVVLQLFRGEKHARLLGGEFGVSLLPRQNFRILRAETLSGKKSATRHQLEYHTHVFGYSEAIAVCGIVLQVELLV